MIISSPERTHDENSILIAFKVAIASWLCNYENKACIGFGL